MSDPTNVANCGDGFTEELTNLLSTYGLEIVWVDDDTNIPGSFFGEPEAGLIGQQLYLRTDTPVHSALHESGHYICMDPQRRAALDTDAEGDYDEENGVCYLQILLAHVLPNMGKARMMHDMDSWGYTFRLGSAKAWFEQDAQDAFEWLRDFGIIDSNANPTWQLRQHITPQDKVA